ncbi:MAG: DNA/RNA nuclease SfsA [Candidatus Hodarchaeota archaeon]
MHWPDSLISARLIQRENRFLARVKLEDSNKVVFAHVPSPGRMHELFLERAHVLLRKGASSQRKTGYDLFAVKTPEDILVIVDSRIANVLVKEALERKQIFPILELLPEQRFGNSRFDFLVKKTSGQNVWIEAKSVTLKEHGTRNALFPDAPTLRGSRHLEELIIAINQGYEAMVIFAIMRDDCDSFSPNKATDPRFAITLQRAGEAGVDIRAYCLAISKTGFMLGNEVSISL